MSDLVSRLLAAIEETERLAQDAIDPDRPGTHWHWVTDETDTPVAAGELAEAQNHQRVSLRTVEEFESSYGMLPAFFLYGEDVQQGAGEHIAHNDPAAVLRRCTADRGVVDMYRGAQLHPMLHDPYSYAAGQHDALWQAVQLIAFGYGISTEEKPPGSATDPS